MKALPCLIVTLFVLCAGLAGVTEKGIPSVQGINVLVETVDGSRVVGFVDITSLRLMSIAGAVDLPLDRLQRLTVNDDSDTVTVGMRGGDRISGALALRELTVTASWGTVRVGVEELRELTTLGDTNGIPKVLWPGLLLWNRMDTHQDLSLGTVGAGGTLDGGQFVDGHSGKAIALDLKKQDRLVFLAETGRTPSGCVEFRFKLSGLSAGRPQQARFPLLRMETSDSNDVCEVELTPDNGKSHGGLCVRGRLGRFASAFRSSARSETTSKTCADGQWHHLAVVWNSATNAKHRIQMFLNGHLDTHVGENQEGESFLFNQAGLVRMTFPGSASADAAGVLAIDDLHVWNFDKTDFSAGQPAAAETVAAARQALPGQLALDFADGSRIIGIPADATFGLQTQLGRFDMPFADTKLVVFDGDGKVVTVLLRSGERLSGTFDLRKLRLVTLFGEIPLDTSSLDRIVCAGTSEGDRDGETGGPTTRCASLLLRPACAGLRSTRRRASKWQGVSDQ